MKSAQELIHWLELGRGSRWLGRAALLVGGLLLTLVYSWKQFHGIPSEFTMQQAVEARQIAQGGGFTTLVDYPQTYAYQKKRGIGFDANRPYAELSHAPLYPLVLAAGLSLAPRSIWHSRPAQPGNFTPDGWLPDYVVLGVNLTLWWLSVWLVWRLGRRLFDDRVAWIAALGTVAAVPLWQQTVSVSGLPLFMVLSLSLFLTLTAVEERAAESPVVDRAMVLRLVGAGAATAGLCLTEYSAGLVMPVVGGFLAWRVPGRFRAPALAVFLGVFAVLLAPWVIRNIQVSGHPLGLAWQGLALRAGDSTAEPAAQRATGSAEAPAFSLNKLGNKGLGAMEQNFKERLWSGGGMLFTAFFVAGLVYRFRRASVNRVRWCFAAVLLVLLVAQPYLVAGESARLPAHYLAPLIILFGAGFLLVLIDSQASLVPHWKWVATGLLTVQALPLLRDSLEPKRIHFHFPPYYPGLFMGLTDEMQSRFLPGTGVATDVPAGTAWYGGRRVWAKPERLRDLSEIMVDQNIGALLLTPVTLDRPFFAELASRKDDTIRFADSGGWGEVYAGLVTRRMPPRFPLNLPPQKLTDNMLLLVNPQTLLRGGN